MTANACSLAGAMALEKDTNKSKRTERGGTRTMKIFGCNALVSNQQKCSCSVPRLQTHSNLHEALGI